MIAEVKAAADAVQAALDSGRLSPANRLTLAVLRDTLRVWQARLSRPDTTLHTFEPRLPSRLCGRCRGSQDAHLAHEIRLSAAMVPAAALASQAPLETEKHNGTQGDGAEGGRVARGRRR